MDITNSVSQRKAFKLCQIIEEEKSTLKEVNFQSMGFIIIILLRSRGKLQEIQIVLLQRQLLVLSPLSIPLNPLSFTQGHWFGTFLLSLDHELVFEFLPHPLSSGLAKIKFPKMFGSASQMLIQSWDVDLDEVVSALWWARKTVMSQ